jgi:hypothetical protein
VRYVLCGLAFWTLALSAMAEEPKYKRGDCITPIDPAHAWHGQYARVEGSAVFMDFWDQGISYVLWFPRYRSRTNLYAQVIEPETKKVPPRKCVSGR